MAMDRTNKEWEQTTVVVQPGRHYHEPVEAHNSNRGVNALIAIFITAFFALVGIGAVAAHEMLVQAGILFFYGSIVLIPLVMSMIVGYLLWHKHYMDRQKRNHAELDVRAKENQMGNERLIAQATAERILAEAEAVRITVKFDEQGNAALRNPHTWQVIQLQGQMREHPGLHSLSYRNDYKDTSTKVSEEKPGIPLFLPERVLMLDVMRKWDLRPDNLFLALGKGHQEIACSLEDLMHVAHDAPTGGGKTAQFYAEIIMLLKLGVRVILANPHFAPLGKKGEDWRPIGQCIEAQGMIEIAPDVHIPGLIRNYQNIASMLGWLATVEIDRRFTMQAVGDYSYKPIYIFVDEWPAVVRRHPEAAEYQVDVLQRGRAVEVCIDTNSQGFLSEDVDLKGSARENFNTAFHMGGSVHSGSRLLDMPIRDMNKLLQTEQVALGKGIALLRNNAALPQAQLVRLPYAENSYCYYMLGRADTWQLAEFRDRKGVPDTGNVSETFGSTEEHLVETVYTSIPGVPENHASKRVHVPSQEREQIIRLAKIGVARRDMCSALGKGKHYYEIVKQVLDEEEL